MIKSTSCCPYLGDRLAPGFVALYQVNVEIPSNVATGAEVPVVLLQNGVPSNTATIAVQ